MNVITSAELHAIALFFKADGLETIFLQHLDRLNNQRTIRPSTIGDDLLISRQLGRQRFRLFQWNGKGSRNVTAPCFVTSRAAPSKIRPATENDPKETVH